jgi:hypothetical protein
MALALVFSHAGIPLGRACSPHFSVGDFGRLCKTVDHLSGGKLFMASETHGAPERPAEMFVAAPVSKEQNSLSVLLDGLCRLVFFLNWQADEAGMADPTLMLN